MSRYTESTIEYIRTREHDELACLTGAVAMYSALLDEADELSTRTRTSYDRILEELRLRERLPKLLAQLNPVQRAIMRDHLHHVEGLVAFVHRLEAKLAQVPKSDD